MSGKDGKRAPNDPFVLFTSVVDPYSSMTFERHGAETKQIHEQARIAALEAELKRVSDHYEAMGKAPTYVVTVLEVRGRRVLNARGTEVSELEVTFDAAPGDQLRVNGKGGVMDRYPEPIVFGPVAVVSEVMPGGRLMLSIGPNQVVSRTRAGLEAEPGDRVQLDPSGQIALLNLGKGSGVSAPPPSARVTWDDVAGQEEAKEALRQALVYPRLHAAAYAALGESSPRGVLLHGPPGVGKTMLGKAAACEVSSPEGFIYVAASELLGRWLGESEGNLRAVFGRARAFTRREKLPAVLFFDEADAILSARGGSGVSSGGVGVASLLVPTFLAEMDGFSEPVFVVLSTNRPGVLDPAVVRDGRFDRRVEVGYLDRAAALSLLLRDFGKRLCSEGVEKTAQAALEAALGDDLVLYELITSRGRERLHLRDGLSGAFLAGVGRRAAAKALKRVREGERCDGVRPEEAAGAVWESFLEFEASEVLRSWAEKRGEKVTEARDARKASGARIVLG